MLSSTDKNFRPTDAIFGSDGALYVSDWQNVIIGHMQHNIRDPNRDKKHGRIYRIVNESRPLQKPVAIDGQPVAALLENLSHPTLGMRHRTRVELSERKTDEVIAATKEWMPSSIRRKRKTPIICSKRSGCISSTTSATANCSTWCSTRPSPTRSIAAKTVQHHWDVADPVKNVVTSPVGQVEEKIKVKVPRHLTKAEARVYRLGSEVYHREAHCVTCHQESGLGMPNVYPPLVDSPWVTGNEDRLIKLTLHGLWGPLEVNGTTFDPAKGVPPMTAFKSMLKDEEVAAVLSYVRNTWGNKASVIQPRKR